MMVLTQNTIKIVVIHINVSNIMLICPTPRPTPAHPPPARGPSVRPARSTISCTQYKIIKWDKLI